MQTTDGHAVFVLTVSNSGVILDMASVNTPCHAAAVSWILGDLTFCGRQVIERFESRSRLVPTPWMRL
ncbi:hypothetical protein AcV7_008908 [Taiwanofungus camphoratus]|nr:hypothetical protein AcV7_008908 [Antrodia cinnamomea]